MLGGNYDSNTPCCVCKGHEILPSANIINVHKEGTPNFHLLKELSIVHLYNIFSHNITPQEDIFNAYDGLLCTDDGFPLMWDPLHVDRWFCPHQH
jgi:hypothetical protein